MTTIFLSAAMKRALSLLVRGGTVQVWAGARTGQKTAFISSPGDMEYECTVSTADALIRRGFVTLREETARFSLYVINDAGREAYQGVLK